MSTKKQEETAAHKTRLRQQGYMDGATGREKRSDDPLYLVSYRRGAEARERGGDE